MLISLTQVNLSRQEPAVMLALPFLIPSLARLVGYGCLLSQLRSSIRSATTVDPLPNDCPSGRLRLIVPLLGIKRSQLGNMERDYCNDGVSSILADIENTARQLALSAKEIPINGNNFYI